MKLDRPAGTLPARHASTTSPSEASVPGRIVIDIARPNHTPATTQVIFHH